MKLFLVFAAILVFMSSALGQQGITSTCPGLSIDQSSGIVKPGGIGTFSARIDTRGVDIRPTYKWTISAGTIVSGQGTEKIEVRSPSKWITTARVEVQGFPLGCPNVAEETSSTAWMPGEAPNRTKVAEFTGPLAHANFSGIIDAANREPASQLFIILSGTSRNRTQSIRNKRDEITEGIRQLNAQHRITFIESTKKDDLTIIWLVPPGGRPPLP